MTIQVCYRLTSSLQTYMDIWVHFYRPNPSNSHPTQPNPLHVVSRPNPTHQTRIFEIRTQNTSDGQPFEKSTLVSITNRFDCAKVQC